MSLLAKYEPVPFSQWYAENKEDLEQQMKATCEVTSEISRCEECGGDGSVECDRGHEHDCEECDGTGRVTLKPDELLYEFAFHEYSDWKSRDFRKWTDYNKQLEGAVCQ